MDQELLCRTCFTKTTRCLSIFSEFKLWDKVISLYKMIMACAPVEISVTDGLPSKICENCLRKLQYSFLFRMQILQADIKLRNYARKTRVSYSNSVIGNFLPESILKDSKSNIQEIYSLDQILQSSPMLNANISDNDESFNESSNKNELKTERIKNEITEFIEEVIVISDEDVIHLKTDKQICSMESSKVHVEKVVKIETNTVFCNESSYSNSPLHDETVVNPDNLPTTVTFNENNEIQIVTTPQIHYDDLTVSNNKIETGVTYNKHSISSVTDSTNDNNGINTNNTLLDQTVSICSLQSTTFGDNANAILSPLINKSDPNRGRNVLTLNTIENVTVDQSQVNATSDALQKTSMYPKDERPFNEQNISTCNKQNTTKGLPLVIKHTVNEKANTHNLEAFEIPNKKQDLVQRVNAINMKMKNITGEKDDRCKTMANNAKSFKTGMSSMQECNNMEMKLSLKNKTIHTGTKTDTNKTESNTLLQVQTIATSVYKYPTNSKILQNVPSNNNTVVAVNRTKNKQKPDKNNVVSKDERTSQNSHLSEKINLTDQISSVTSFVRRKASSLSQKNCKNFMALMTVDDFIRIGNKPGTHSTVKFYKIPTNTLLHESAVVTCSKQGNDVSVSGTSNSRNAKNKITSIKQDNSTVFIKGITRSNSASSTLSQSCVSSSIQKNANNSTEININNSKRENTAIYKKIVLPQSLQDFNFKRKASHKVYVNKRKKY